MDKQTYAGYLLDLMGEESDPDEDVEKEAFYGYFQMYMPSGEGVEATFEPLTDGDAYVHRIRRIYEMLEPEDFTGDAVPGYFNGKGNPVPEDVLIDFGKQHIQELKQLLEAFPDEEEAREAVAYLSKINDIHLLQPGQLNAIRSAYDPDVYEVLSEVIRDQQKDESLIEILDEAYYSIACDYWISYYLQWPRYGLPGDPFAPYFELHSRGYSAVFSDGTLYIGAS
ncbi:hypothetical protein [Gorillibacterium sp. CAU 1737]|uniref:hypothetical protein n=1 Tax=Gorillibacterium sp. CAU 1737 TaxID=3140362 RepID=UPI00325FE405